MSARCSGIMAPVTLMESMVVAGAALFFASQVFNRVSLQWRAVGSLLGLVLALVAVTLDYGAWEAGVFGWFLAAAALIGKWGREVADDIDTREGKGKPRLGRDFLGINTSLNPCLFCSIAVGCFGISGLTSA
jgi:hypothetical protein